MRLKTSSSENRKQPSSVRSCVWSLRAVGATLREIVDQAGGRVERLVLVLREVIHLHVVSQAKFAGRRRFRAGQQLDERGLAGAVHAHQGDSVAAVDDEAHALEDPLCRRSSWRRRETPPPCARSAGGCGNEKWMVFSSAGISIRSIFSSSLIRLCTCLALVAW